MEIQRMNSIGHQGINYRSDTQDTMARKDTQAIIKAMGVGDAGNNIINRMIEEKVNGVRFIEVNTNAKILNISKTPNVIQIGKETTKGLGAGTNTSLGEMAAIESKEEIREVLQNTDMLFLTAGMGGGTGTGAIPVIAKIAKEMKILTIGIVTKPFLFEGKKRELTAEYGIEQLKNIVDALIIIPNNNLLKASNKDTSMKDAFKLADEVLKKGIIGITDLITTTGEINIDYADVKAIMQYQGGAYLGIGTGEGKRAVLEAIIEAIDNEITEIKIDNAKGVILNIKGDFNLSLSAINDGIQLINDRIDPDANIIFGTTVDKTMGEKVQVTIIATGIKEEEQN